MAILAVGGEPPSGSLPLARRFRRFSRDVANLALGMGEGGRSDVVSNFAHAQHACAFNQRSTLVGELETSDISCRHQRLTIEYPTGPNTGM
jgi:hypothetical protein